MVQSNQKDSEQRLQSEHVATEVNRWFSRTGWCRFNHVKFVRLNFCPLIASHIPIEPLKNIWYVYNCIIYLEYGHTLWIHDLVAQCTLKIAQALPPSFRHPEAPTTLPTIIKHCPGRTKSSGEQNRWLSWFGSLRIGPENLDVHNTRLFPATLNYAPQNFKRWFQMPASPTPDGHGFSPHVPKHTWMHFAYEVQKNYKIWSVFRQTQRSKHGPFSWAKWVSDSCWWHKERANDKQTNTASFLLRHTIGYFLQLQPNSKWLQTSPNPQRQWHILMWTAGHRR